MVGLTDLTSLVALAIVIMVTGNDFNKTHHDNNALHHRYANYSGDLLLVGFFPIHQKLGAADSIYICGDVQEQDGIQALEMFLYTLDKINQGFLPNFTLGAVAFDSCDDELYALQQAVDMVAVLMSRTGYNQNSYICKDGTRPEVSQTAKDLHKVFAIVGGSSSTVTLNLASFFSLFNVPQISYLATTTDLTNKERYPHFKRTVPSDSVQARAIVTLLKSFNWTYVGVIYEDSNYGIKGYSELERWAEEDGVCFASDNRVDFNDPKWTDSDYDVIIQNMLEKDEAKVVVLYVDWDRALKIFEAAERNNVTNITWVGSDAWSGRSSAVKGFEHIANGAVTLQPHAYVNPDFDAYFKGLNIKNNRRNPWFKEFWESHFNCKLDEDINRIRNCNIQQCRKSDYADVLRMRGLNMTTLDTQCTGNEIIGNDSYYYQQNYLHFISDAVLAYAHALKAMHKDVCGPDYVGLCPAMTAHNLTGPMVTSYLDNQTFTASCGLDFQFFNGQDGPPRYTILNYIYNASSDSGIWVEVGNYSGEYSEDGVNGEHHIRLDADFITKMQNTTTSVCSLPCAIDEARQYVQPWDNCCWVCVTCDEDEIVLVSVLGDVCKACEYGLYPSKDRRKCEKIPETYMHYRDGVAIGAMVFAIVGVLATISTFTVFIIYGNTPVVKASGRELSYYLLVALTLAFSSTFLIVHRPTGVICGANRVLVGLCFTMIYASILTKTNRISRIFNGGGPKGGRARYTTPMWQIAIVNVLVFVELLVLLAWLIASPPGITHVYPTRLDNVLVCSGEQGATYLVGLIYPAILLFCCAVYAFRTRKTPDGFNETKHIGIVSYTTVVILLALFPVFFLTDDPGVKTIAICLTLSLTSAVVWCCIFVPKLYICLFRPNKNTKEAIMQRTTSVLSSISMNSYNRDNSNSREASCSFCGKDNSTTKETADYNSVIVNPAHQWNGDIDTTNHKTKPSNDIIEIAVKHEDMNDNLNDDVNNEMNNDTMNNETNIDVDNGIVSTSQDDKKYDGITSTDETSPKAPNRRKKSVDVSTKKRNSASSVSFAKDVDIISAHSNSSYKDTPDSTPPVCSTPIQDDDENNVKDEIIAKGSDTDFKNKKNLALQKALGNLNFKDSGIVDEHDNDDVDDDDEVKIDENESDYYESVT